MDACHCGPSQFEEPPQQRSQRTVVQCTLFGLFFDGLHAYQAVLAAAAGVQIQQLRLRELVYADDICLIASSHEQLQALINSLASFCKMMRMEA